jgi:trimethylamine--corrinoid protein Co-methyltransferase
VSDPRSRAEAADSADARRRRRGRSARRARPAETTHHYRRLLNPFRPLTVLSDDETVQIHEAALEVLANSGIRVLLPEARRRLEQTGAVVDESDLMVRFDPEMVTAALATAPAVYDVVPTAPDRSVTFGGTSVVMSPAGGPPHATDLERGRRNGTLDDFQDFVRLTQHFDVLHTTNPIVEPQDVALEVRHLETTRAQMLLSDKIPFIYSRGRARVTDSLEIVRIANRVDHDEFTSIPRCFTVINTNSPRQLDVSMCLGLIQFAEMNQVAIITPFTLAGAMAPVTLAGALTLQHAEALAAIALSQTARPGAPVVYGAFTSNVDMRSGSPAFGTPEAVKAAYASGQLARHIGLPWRSSAVSTSNTPDAQAGYETMMNMMGAALAGANVIIHAAGWMESGLAASLEKFILDTEMVQMWAETFRPLEVSEAEIGLGAIEEVEPGGHFFGVEHTLDRFHRAFYEPIVFSRQNFEQWTEAGALSAAQRATPIWKRILDQFEPPSVDDAIHAEIDDFVARREAEGGAPPES